MCNYRTKLKTEHQKRMALDICVDQLPMIQGTIIYGNMHNLVIIWKRKSD